MDFLVEFLSFVRHRKKYWMVPFLLVLTALLLLSFLAESSIITPFIYTLF